MPLPGVQDRTGVYPWRLEAHHWFVVMTDAWVVVCSVWLVVCVTCKVV